MSDTSGEIADAVVTRLREEHWIPGSLPVEIGRWIRDSTRGYSRLQANMIYLDGAQAIRENWVVAASGALSLELQDVNGKTFWRGTFEPLGM